MMRTNNFFIKSGYSPRETGAYFEDSLVSDAQIVHQPDVYTLVAHVGRMFGCTHVLDIGCGRGHKLVKLHPEFNLVGVDYGANFNFCNGHYSFGQWLCLDLEEAHPNLLPTAILERTVVVCSDVIEHLADPTGLLTTLVECLKYAPVAIVTTPERDLVGSPHDMGPPASPAHVREWNQVELTQFLKAASFEVAFIGLTCNNDRDWDKKSIMTILHGSSLCRKAAANSDFRVIAIMTAYNEEDIIFHSVKRLIDNGVDVYLIDNWSSDGTVAAIEPLLGQGLIGIERFPANESNGTFDLQRLLARVEEITRTLTADWFIHHDADEIRESPWPEMSLREALQYVDQLGFSAIDHTVIDFRPVNNDFIAGSDFESQFSFFEFGRRPGHFRQIKAWKNLGLPITLADTGGHDVNFSGRRVFPYKFLLRHYPVRSQLHGERKVLLERKLRFNAEERKLRGWHGHYDHIQGGHNFLYDPNLLIEFNPASFYQNYLLERISGIGILRKKAVDAGKLDGKGLFHQFWSWFLRVRRQSQRGPNA